MEPLTDTLDSVLLPGATPRRRSTDRGERPSIFLMRWDWNWPNALTASRFVLVPLQIVCLLNDALIAAFVLFLIAGASDFLDGFLARKLNQRTEGGAVLDPLADKFTMMATFLTLMLMGIVPLWLAMLVFFRDIFILFAVALLIKGRRRIPWKAVILGKVTTVFQNLTILAAILQHYTGFPSSIFTVLTLTTAALTVISWIHYFLLWQKIWAAPKLAA